MRQAQTPPASLASGVCGVISACPSRKVLFTFVTVHCSRPRYPTARRATVRPTLTLHSGAGRPVCHDVTQCHCGASGPPRLALSLHDVTVSLRGWWAAKACLELAEQGLEVRRAPGLVEVSPLELLDEDVRLGGGERCAHLIRRHRRGPRPGPALTLTLGLTLGLTLALALALVPIPTPTLCWQPRAGRA